MMQPGQVESLIGAMDRAAARLATHSVIRDLDATLREIVAAAVEAVPGATHAGLTVRAPDGRILSTAPTTELVARLDQAQATLREGPCVLATDLGEDHIPAPDPPGDDRPGTVMVQVDDMTREADGIGRWPRFAPEALRNGIVSMLSLTLASDRAKRTALNLYSEQPAVFDRAAQTTAQVFADQAAVALYGAEQVASLQQAVASRDIIGQAKGILIERHRIDGDEAFGMLVSASQDTNIKLAEVARWLVDDTSTRAR